MIAVDRDEVEAPTLAKEAWKNGLRLLGVVLHQLGQSRLVEELQTTAGESRRLIRIEDDVSRAFADTELQAELEPEPRRLRHRTGQVLGRSRPDRRLGFASFGL